MAARRKKEVRQRKTRGTAALLALSQTALDGVAEGVCVYDSDNRIVLFSSDTGAWSINTAPSITDVVAGRIATTIASVISTRPFFTSGKLRALATVGHKRSPALLHPGNLKAQQILAEDMRNRTPCLWATPCGYGCAIRANYQSTTVHLPPALKTGNLDIVTDAMVYAMNGLAPGRTDQVRGRRQAVLRSVGELGLGQSHPR